VTRDFTDVLISTQSDQERKKLMYLSEWREFSSVPCLAGKKNLMTARVLMLLKSRKSLTCFRACFLLGRAKELSASRYINCVHLLVSVCVIVFTLHGTDNTKYFRCSNLKVKDYLQDPSVDS